MSRTWHTLNMTPRMSARRRDAAERITISLPKDLYEWGEFERQRARISRSQFVADLYRRYREALEERRRVARYAAAYAKTPSTEAEDYLVSRSAELLLADSDL